MLSSLAATTSVSSTTPTLTVDSGVESAGSSPEIMLTSSQTSPPMSRTHQYRKVMKPLLERKRRARINRCLDELKDLMVTALQAEGESITKLEKADVLELTVRHLRKLKQQNALGLTPEATYAGRFKAGYAHCAQEVSNFMSSKELSPAMDTGLSSRLLSHLGGCMRSLEASPPSTLTVPSLPYLVRPTPTTAAVAAATGASLTSTPVDASGALDLSSSSVTPSGGLRSSRQTSEDSVASSTASSKSGDSVRNQGDSDRSWRPW